MSRSSGARWQEAAGGIAPRDRQRRIVVVGGGLAERMQHHGWLEARLVSRFGDLDLVFRNLAYSGDEIDGFKNSQHRLRSMSFEIGRAHV